MSNSLADLFARGNGHLDRHFEWSERMEEMVSRAVEHVLNEVVEDQYLFLYGLGDTGADVAADIKIGPVPAGAVWQIKQLSTTGANAGPCAIYLDQIAPQNLIDMVNNAGTFADMRDYFVPPGRTMVFHFYAQPNNQKVTAAIQVKQFTNAVDDKAYHSS